MSGIYDGALTREQFMFLEMRKVAQLTMQGLTEEEILNSGADLKSTVLKVGHHGSRTSTSYPFLREVMPQYAVISVEKGNSYGHPNEETLSKLSDAGVEVYRTDESGDIVMTSDGNSISITTSK